MRAKRLWNRINTQILVWAGDEREMLKYDGVPLILPAWNETASKKLANGSPNPASPFRFEGARDGSDRMIPGTVLLEDLINRTPEGGVIKTFDVTTFCEFLERDQAYLFERGLEIVTDPKDVPAAMATARPLWAKNQTARAQQILAQEMDRLAKYEESGRPAPSASNAPRVAWAISMLKGLQPDIAAFGKEELAAVLSGQYVAPSVSEIPPSAASLSAKEILVEAREIGMKLNKTELEALLEDDAEQIGFIQEKLKARREAQAATA